MLSRKAEDYLEAIYVILKKKGYIRVNLIAKEMGVTAPSVCEMLMKLNEKGLVGYEKFGGVTLTKKGKEIAKAVKDRHDTIRRFLKMINVPEEIAEKDACTIEHHLDPKTIIQLKKFVDSIENNAESLVFLKPETWGRNPDTQ